MRKYVFHFLYNEFVLIYLIKHSFSWFFFVVFNQINLFARGLKQFYLLFYDIIMASYIPPGWYIFECGTFVKSVLCFFEESCMLLWRGCMLLWIWWCATLAHSCCLFYDIIKASYIHQGWRNIRVFDSFINNCVIKLILWLFTAKFQTFSVL